MTSFRHTCDVQMRFNDLDLFGHINNTVYLQYMDLGKEQYISRVIGDIFSNENEAMVIVNLNCDYFQITKHKESLEVRTRVDSIGKHSLTFEQEVVSKATGEVKCRCRTVMVGFSPARNESIEIPPHWRKAISEYEGRQL